MITVRALEPFKILYNLPEATSIIVCIGGRGGAKTYEVSKFVAYSSTIKKKRTVILRDEKELVRESILNEVLLRYDTANAYGTLDHFYERLETGIKDRSNDSMLVFTKGFRASSLEKTANLKSISDIDIAVIEEAEDIRDETKFSRFADSIRKEGSMIIIILNTPDIGHWIVKRYFNTRLVEAQDPSTGMQVDGYFEITPKDIPGFVCIQTSFEDNSHLPGHIVDNYRNYGNPQSHLFNFHYFLTEIKGYASVGRRGQIIRKAKPIKLKDYLALPFRETYGLDFGTSSPAGIVGVKKDKSTIYTRQLNYKPLNTLEIAIFFCMLKLGPADLIVADSADPKAIAKLSHGYNGEELSEDLFRKYPKLRTGFNVIGARKGTDSIKFGIDILDQSILYVVEESKDYWEEIRNYIYAKDKNENYTNDPVDEFNHLIDPLRYVVMELEKDYAHGYKRKN